MSIYDEIAAERARQDALHGGTAHDDTHGPHDWIVFIVKHASYGSLREGASIGASLDAFRKQMIRVAALAVAATEWVDRELARLVNDAERRR